MKLKTLQDLHVKHKTVLLRASLNVPIEDGKVDDDLRLKAAVPTIKYLLEHDAKVVLMSHHSHEGQSLAPVAQALAALLNQPVTFVPDCVGPTVIETIQSAPNGSVVMLENLRFHPEEEANDEGFAHLLASLGDVYVDDDFTTMHRAHASMVGIPKILPSAAGLQVLLEVETITKAMENPKRPVLAVIGGAKIATKIDVIHNLLAKVDHLLIGGEMANTFLASLGTPIGKSLYEPAEKQVAQNVLDTADSHGMNIILPTDVVVSKTIDETGEAKMVAVTAVTKDDYIVDLGPETIDTALATIDGGTVIWNGPLGITEVEQFSMGSKRLAEGIFASGAFSIIGGGDTADYVDGMGWHDKFSFVSTGGGASLELMAGKPMPGLEALQA